jgi:myo-inositol-1(or 4)-monophosphatase
VETNIGRPRQRGAVGRVSDALLRHVRDVRRGGSAAAALAQVATGRADAYWGPGLQPWDAAAGLLLVAEAGGRIGDLDGPSAGVWPSSGNVLASSKEIWEDLRVLLEEAFGADGE